MRKPSAAAPHKSRDLPSLPNCCAPFLQPHCSPPRRQKKPQYLLAVCNQNRSCRRLVHDCRMVHVLGVGRHPCASALGDTRSVLSGRLRGSGRRRGSCAQRSAERSRHRAPEDFGPGIPAAERGAIGDGPIPFRRPRPVRVGHTCICGNTWRPGFSSDPAWLLTADRRLGTLAGVLRCQQCGRKKVDVLREQAEAKRGATPPTPPAPRTASRPRPAVPKATGPNSTCADGEQP